MFGGHSLKVALVLLTAIVLPLAAQTPGQPPPIARDTPAQPRSATATANASISGHVVAADTGRPLAGARVVLRSSELPGGRIELTDDRGNFSVTELSAGRYTVTANRSGFVTLAYGQRRPLQPGTPLQLASGQQLTGLEIRLPRGSVISGHIYDERGDPLAGTMVQVLRYQYVQGARQLVAVGNAQSDDRGQYRVWGINPGEYYVSATIPPPNLGNQGPGGGENGDAPTRGYAPMYFPGVSSAGEARPVTIGLSAEALGVDFTLLRVRTSTITGRVATAEGSPARGGTIMLLPEGQAGGGGPVAGGRNGRILADGTFTLSMVTPGRYILRAIGNSGRGRGNAGSPPQFASQPLSVDGDMTTYVTLTTGGTLSGTVVLQSAGTGTIPPLNQFRVTTRAIDGVAMAAAPNGRINSDSTFTLPDVAAGSRLIRAQVPQGWTLESVTWNGRDITDTPIDVRSGARITGLRLGFTNVLSSINGTVSDQRGAPITEYTVLAFPRNGSLWRPDSRHIMTARPDQTGRFEMQGLPAADYYVAIVDPAEPGEWFDPAFLEEHRTGAAMLTLREGETKTQDFKIAVR